VNYCKLFRFLIKHDLPACIISVLINIHSLPRETCWSCKQLNDDVTLCADDRWCRDCVRENDRKLAAARSVDQSTSVADRTFSLITPAATGSGRSTRSTAIGRSVDDNTKVNERCVPKSDA